MRLATGFLHLHDLVVDLRVATREEGATVDDHVHLIRAELDDDTGLVDLELCRRLPGRKRGRHRRDLHAASGKAFLRSFDEVRVETDCRNRRHRRVQRIGPHRLRAQRRDLARRVLALEGGQIHHPDREVERLQLGLALDRPLRERRGALLERHGVDRADTRESGARRKLEPAYERRRCRHASSVSPSACTAWRARISVERGRLPRAANRRPRKRDPTAGSVTRYAHNPSRSSILGSRRHFGRTLTTSSRKTECPTRASTSGRARVPISRTIAPFFPTRIPFCDSVST